jgi:hypothetical protein
MLPEGVNQPVIAQASLLGEMMIIALESDTINPMDLRTLAEWNLNTQAAFNSEGGR